MSVTDIIIAALCMVLVLVTVYNVGYERGYSANDCKRPHDVNICEHGVFIEPERCERCRSAWRRDLASDREFARWRPTWHNGRLSD